MPSSVLLIPDSEFRVPISNAAAAFDAELSRFNLRNAQWLAISGIVFIAAVWVLRAFRPLPLGPETGFLDGLLCATGLLSLACIAWFRRRSVAPIWPRVLLLADAVLLLAATQAYFFVALPAYGVTSIYIIGVLTTAVFFRFPPRVMGPFLLANHAIFTGLFLQQPLPPNQIVSVAIDYTGVVILASVAGWLLYRAHVENFRKERVIVEHNLELTRLHQLELDEKISAKLGEEKAQLEVLRYQLNPHFLYNTLNSLYALVAQQPEAGPMVLRLAEFCRLTLTRGSEFQSIGAEFVTLRAYLDVEQFRWADKLVVTINATPDAERRMLPPFLLLPLVENAMKHGLATSRARLEVRLSARLEAAGEASKEQGADTEAGGSALAPTYAPCTLVIEVANTGRWSESPAPGVASTGIGLENLRRRLQRTYPDAHTFTIGQEGDWVVARLRLAAQQGTGSNPGRYE